MIQIKDKVVIKRYLEKYNIDRMLTNIATYEFELCSFTAGEFISKAGESLGYFYFFLEGKAKVYTVTESGKALLFTFYNHLEFVGDVELVLHKKMIAYVECISEVICFRIDAERYQEQLLKDSIFLKRIAVQLAEKLNHISSSSAGNLLYPLENRLAAYMLSVSEEYIFRENLGQTAELLATSYRHLFRCIKKFLEEKYITKCDGGYSLDNVAKLKQLGKNVYT